MTDNSHTATSAPSMGHTPTSMHHAQPSSMPSQSPAGQHAQLISQSVPLSALSALMGNSGPPRPSQPSVPLPVSNVSMSSAADDSNLTPKKRATRQVVESSVPLPSEAINAVPVSKRPNKRQKRYAASKKKDGDGPDSPPGPSDSTTPVASPLPSGLPLLSTPSHPPIPSPAPSHVLHTPTSTSTPTTIIPVTASLSMGDANTPSTSSSSSSASSPFAMKPIHTGVHNKDRQEREALDTLYMQIHAWSEKVLQDFFARPRFAVVPLATYSDHVRSQYYLQLQNHWKRKASKVSFSTRPFPLDVYRCLFLKPTPLDEYSFATRKKVNAGDDYTYTHKHEVPADDQRLQEVLGDGWKKQYYATESGVQTQVFVDWKKSDESTPFVITFEETTLTLKLRFSISCRTLDNTPMW